MMTQVNGTNLLQDELIFLIQQLQICIDEIQVILRSREVIPPKFLLEFFAVIVDRLMDKHHMLHNGFTILVWYTLDLLKRNRYLIFRDVFHNKKELVCNKICVYNVSANHPRREFREPANHPRREFREPAIFLFCI